jgi:hypothetical protein
LNASSLLGFSRCGSTPEGEVSPENFCQSPVRSAGPTTASLGLSADGTAVLGPLGVDLDHRRVVLGVILADLLDGPPVPLGAESATTMR